MELKSFKGGEYGRIIFADGAEICAYGRNSMRKLLQLKELMEQLDKARLRFRNDEEFNQWLKGQR